MRAPASGVHVSCSQAGPLHVPLTGLACTCAGNLDRAISAGRFKNPDGTPNMVRASRAPEHRPLVSAGAGACWAGVACLSPARLSLSRALRSGPPDASAAGAAQVTVCRCLIDIANGMDYLHSLACCMRVRAGTACPTSLCLRTLCRAATPLLLAHASRRFACSSAARGAQISRAATSCSSPRPSTTTRADSYARRARHTAPA